MIPVEQINKNFNLVVVNAILNSDNSEWSPIMNGSCYKWPRTLRFIKNNIIIEVIIDTDRSYFNHNFMVKLYTDNTHNLNSKEIELEINGWWIFWNKEERNQRKLLKQKYESLRSYQASEMYNLLPIRELRKAKLDTINKIEL